MLIIVFALLAIGIAILAWSIYKADNPIPFIAGFIIFMAISLSIAGAYDQQVLTEYSETMELIDKWHEKSCTADFSAEGGYVGESCSDEWTIVVVVDGVREEREVIGDVFKAFTVPAKLQRNYKLGRLGMTHDVI